MPQSRADAAPGLASAPLAIEAAASGRGGEARSLFGEILDWMFAPLLLLWPMSVSLTYLVAQSIAGTPYDRALIDRGEALAAHLRFDDGHARFEPSAGLLEILGGGAGESGTYLVADSDGAILAGDHDLPRPREPEGGIGANAGGALNGAFQLRDDSLRGHPVRVAFAWVGAASAHPGDRTAAALIEVAESTAERTQLANEIVKGVILPQFVVLPLALVLVWFGLTRGLAPLARLQRTIRNRPPDDLSPIKVDAAPEELAPLLTSFNELLARMTHNLEVQKRFIADAAHQMKTPLAGLRTQAELAQREGEPHELQRSLRQIAASTERATRLVNQLLTLARAEHGAGEPGAMRRVDLDALARAVVRDWVAQAIAQDIDLGYEGPEESEGAEASTILGAPTLLRELLNNLIDNALRYSAAHAHDHAAGTAIDAPQVGDARIGAVTVRVRAAGEHVFLEVEDSGPGIPPEERVHVFERFYRVLGSQQDGSGLGLAIVREIAVQHRAEISLTDAAVPADSQGRNPGALFRIRFERAGGGARSV